jgi:hypothetical protein
MSLSHRFLKVVRTIHLYLGVFSAPALLFFAITGGLQTFSLHEAARDGGYAPPAWLASVAQLHKKQTLVVPVRRPRPAQAASLPSVDPATARMRDGSLARSAAHPTNKTAPVRKNLLPMKIFFVLVALALLISTLSGLYMAWRYSRRPRLFGALLVAGIVVPVLLLL